MGKIKQGILGGISVTIAIVVVNAHSSQGSNIRLMAIDSYRNSPVVIHSETLPEFLVLINAVSSIGL